MNLPEPPLLSEAGGRVLTAAVPGGSRHQGWEPGTAPDRQFPSGGSQDQGTAETTGLYYDVAELLAGGMPEPPAPGVLHRQDGHALFYCGQVNVLFGDPESGKTLVALAAAVETLKTGQRVLFIDIDHNGPQSIVYRLVEMGAPRAALADQVRFRYVEPEDRATLHDVVADCTERWTPDVAIVDSIGELLPMLGLNSNNPDDFTSANSRILKPLAASGAAVIGIDHLAKNTDSRSSGQTGTAAKKRAVGGVSLRVTLKDQFVPGTGGAAYLTINKDRHGGLRHTCPAREGREQAAGLFVIDSSTEDVIRWSIRAPEGKHSAEASGVPDSEIAAIDALDPAPRSIEDARFRLGWRKERTVHAMQVWRFRNGSRNQEPPPA